jgi:hypothetical protein
MAESLQSLLQADWMAFMRHSKGQKAKQQETDNAKEKGPLTT